MHEYYRSDTATVPDFQDYFSARRAGNDNNIMVCNWPLLRSQLLSQWWRLTRQDLDTVGPDRHKIAVLVQRKYGISSRLVENYLANLARTLPVT